ncbi:Prophage CP4-57 regulatory protein (AlpA) [compost metagenome]
MRNMLPLNAAGYAAGSLFDPDTTIIRMPDLAAITGLARPTIYKRLKDDPTFPRPVQLSDSKSRGAPVGFVLSEVQEWVRKRIEMREAVEVKKAASTNKSACNALQRSDIISEE